MVDIKKLAQTLVDLTKEEVIALTKEMKDVHGLTPPEPTVIEKVAEAVVEEKTSFEVKLVDIGPKKLELVKLWKEIDGMSLMDAKKLIETAPVVMKTDLSLEAANSIKERFAEYGATIVVS
jgi:large subunit ribosomal protein L7/L12